jgi:hypothetical protein
MIGLNVKMLFLLTILTTETNKLLNPVFVRSTRIVILELGGLLIFHFSFIFFFPILHLGRFKLPSYTFIYVFSKSYKEKLTVNTE